MWLAGVAFAGLLLWLHPSLGMPTALWVAAGGGLVVWIAHSWWFPRAVCRYCGPRGGPKRRDSTGTVWHRCFWCGGSGERTRFWARLFGGVDDQ